MQHDNLEPATSVSGRYGLNKSRFKIISKKEVQKKYVHSPLVSPKIHGPAVLDFAWAGGLLITGLMDLALTKTEQKIMSSISALATKSRHFLHPFILISFLFLRNITLRSVWCPSVTGRYHTRKDMCLSPINGTTARETTARNYSASMRHCTLRSISSCLILMYITFYDFRYFNHPGTSIELTASPALSRRNFH